MNTSITTTDSSSSSSPFRSFLTGNAGAVVFLISYIGFYGFGIIFYFAYQFISENPSHHDEEIPSEFFQTFHHINEREEIYHQLMNKDWVEQIYQIYYGVESGQNATIEEKASELSKKYHQKIQRLRSRHTYYVEEKPSPLTLNSIVR